MIAFVACPSMAAAVEFKTLPADMTVSKSFPRAASYLLVEDNSMTVLAEHQAHERMPIASLTKIMTLYLVFNALEQGALTWDQKTRVSYKAWKTPGSRMFIKEGDRVSVGDLVRGVIIDSGNDAAVALAELVSGSEEHFVEQMNDTAQHLGMTHTHYVGATGIEEEDHYSTAYDLAVLTVTLRHQFPQYVPLFAEKTFEYGGIKQNNRNRLLWRDARVDGLKTGTTDKAGHCLVATSHDTSMSMIAVVLSAPDDEERFATASAMFNEGYSRYLTKEVAVSHQAMDYLKTWCAQHAVTPVGLVDNWYVTYPKSMQSQLKARLLARDPLRAPLSLHDIVGQIEVVVGEHTLATQPLIALEDNPRANPWRCFFDRILLLGRRHVT